MNAPITYIKGEDPVLRDREAHRLIDVLLDGADKLYALEDFSIESKRRSADDGDASDDTDDTITANEANTFRSVMNALSIPPFMTPLRVVVIRNIASLNADQAAMIAQYIEDPLDGVFVVLVAGGGRLNTGLDKAIKAHKVPIVAPKSEKTGDVLEAALAGAKLTLANSARQTIADRLGDDAGRIPELIALLVSTFGEGVQLRIEEIEPYLGEQGAVAPYMLTNAIDAGDTAAALEILHRLMYATSARAPKPMHPLQIMGMLTRHYETMVRIDSPDVNSKQQAAAVLGMKEYPAGLRLATTQRLGTKGITNAIGLLATADLDFRGGVGGSRAIPSETVIEVLVARLAGLAKRSGAKSAASTGSWRR